MRVDAAVAQGVVKELEANKKDASIVLTEDSILVQRGDEEIGKFNLTVNIGTMKNKDEESEADVRMVIGIFKWKAKMLTYLKRLSTEQS